MLKLSAIACFVTLVACAPENPTWPGKKSCKVLALSGGGSYGVFEALVMFIVHVLTFIHLQAGVLQMLTEKAGGVFPTTLPFIATRLTLPVPNRQTRL